MAALEQVEGWLTTGDAEDVRSAAMVIVWRAAPTLSSLVEPLAGRLSPKDLPETRLWAAHALYALQELGGDVSIAPAFGSLLALVEEDDGLFAVASFAVGAARRRGRSFANAADAVLRTLSARWESSEIYADLLDAGFVPPAHHKPMLEKLLFNTSTSKRDLAVRGLIALGATKHDFDALVAEVLKRLGAKTAKDVQPALCAAGGLVELGVPLARFMAPLEKALCHKVTAVKEAANRMLSSVAAKLAEPDRLREHLVAEGQGCARVAKVLAKDVPPKAQPRAAAPGLVPPALDLAELTRQLRSDALIDLRTALARTPRAHGAELEELLPALLDALATEERHNALAQLTRAMEEGSDLRFALPVVAGLLLDRDFYDQMSLAEIVRFLLAALARGYDISMAWPWVPSFLEGARCGELRFQLAKNGLRAGLDGRTWGPWLLRSLVEVSPVGHPSGVQTALRALGDAAECLALLSAARVSP